MTTISESSSKLDEKKNDKQDEIKKEDIKLDEIFVLLKAGQVDEAIKYVEEGRLKEIDCVDESGTTPLQYAAFRGFYDLCVLLMRKGADVNAKCHDERYSALMFAAISNHVKVVNLLLENGADVDATNALGRTATQMAAFVNSNECVDVINSYIPKKALEYYTETHSIYDKEPKLPKGDCLYQLYKLLVSASSRSYSPVFIIKMIRELSNTPNNKNVLMGNVQKITRTLDALITKTFKVDDTPNACPNDLLAFKLHYFRYIFEYLQTQQMAVAKKYDNERDEEKRLEKLYELSIKTLLFEEKKKSPTTGVTERHKIFQEKFLRESIRQFPYKECALVRQMATILSQTTIGAHPSALYVITSCLNGQRLNSKFDDETSDAKNAWPIECHTCLLKSIDAKLCTHCKKVAYCDKYCQKLDWPTHKSL